MCAVYWGCRRCVPLQLTCPPWAAAAHYHRYGGGGAWMYSSIAGIAPAAGTRGWKDLVIAPPAQRLVNLSGASASLDTAAGLAAVAWTTSVPSGLCGMAPENSNVTRVRWAAGGHVHGGDACVLRHADWRLRELCVWRVQQRPE